MDYLYCDTYEVNYEMLQDERSFRHFCFAVLLSHIALDRSVSATTKCSVAVGLLS